MSADTFAIDFFEKKWKHTVKGKHWEEKIAQKRKEIGEVGAVATYLWSFPRNLLAQLHLRERPVYHPLLQVTIKDISALP